MAKLSLLIIVISIQSYVFATTFLPVPIKRQIAESSGIVEGEVISTEAVLDRNGRIVTKVFMRADKWIGVRPEAGHLEVYYPGGQVGDRVQKVHGAPKFDYGERVVLLLKSDKNSENKKLWVQNLALGKYMIKKYGTTDIVINSVFPKDPKVGQMALNSFYSLATRIKNQDFKERFKDKYELQVEKENKQFSNKKLGRAIASVRNFEEKEEENHISTIWTLIILGVLGALFSFSRRRKSE